MLRRILSHPILWGFLTTLVLAWLGYGLRFSDAPIARQIQRVSYDGYFSWLRSVETPPTNSPVLLVILDQETHQELQQSTTRPWPRQLHARLLDRLRKAGARSVSFDILFDQPGADPQADQEFMRSLRASGYVVLSGERSEWSERQGDGVWGSMTRITPPHAPLAAAAHSWGLAALEADEDFTCRRQFAGLLDDQQYSLHIATGRMLKLAAADDATLRAPRWTRYYGPSLEGLPHVSYAKALDPQALPDSLFKDRIIFVGARTEAGLFGDRKDQFRSPFRRWNSADTYMPGVEVHATQMLNLVREDWLRPLPLATERLVLLATALLAGLGLSQFKPFPAALLGLGSMFALTAASSFLFQNQNTWFPWLIPVAVQLPLGIAITSILRSLQWFFTRQAFLAARRVAEKRIREQATLIDKANDAITVRTLSGQLTFANPAALKLFGGSFEELQCHPTDEAWGLDPTSRQNALRTLQSTGEWQGEITHRTRQGDHKILQSRWTLLESEGSGSPSVLQINTDITEQKQLENQVLRGQRLDTIGSLAGGMAHDLNNALAPVLMGVHLLRRQASDPSAREILDVMESSTQRGADMVRQVLLFARGHDQSFQTLELGPLLREVKRMMTDTFPKNITVLVHQESELWTIRGQATQIHQVLLNLCVNARDAIQDVVQSGAQSSGTISISAENVDLDPMEASQIPGAHAGSFVALSVSDTGCGIPPEVLPRIFEPFYSTKAEGRGTGLGLATTLRIVKNHDGFLNIKTEPGQGTTFEVFFPRMDQKSDDPEHKALQASFEGTGKTIVVVDDDAAIRNMLKASLEAHGCRVIACDSSKTALECILRTSGEVHGFMTDTDMPEMGGLALLQKLREAGWNRPALILSGKEWSTEFLAQLPPRVRPLRKPFTLESLLQELKASGI